MIFTKRLDVDALKKLGIPPGPLYAKIKSGQIVQLPNGLQVRKLKKLKIIKKYLSIFID